MLWNRNKRGIRLDLKDADDLLIFWDLVDRADVVLENFRPGVVKRLGIGWDALHARNAQLVLGSISGFGQTGPYAHRAGYDFIIQGMAGLMSVTGEPEGQPQKVGVAVTDVFTGVYAATAILAALVQRGRTGEGQQIDMALMDVATSIMANQAMNYLVSGVAPRRLGNAHPNISPYEAFPTKDSWIIVAVGNDQQFRRFSKIIGLAEDPRFATNAQRVADRQALSAVIATATRQWERDRLLTRLTEEGVPAGPINNVAEAFADPQIRHREMQLSLDRDGQPPVPGVRLPIRFSGATLDMSAASFAPVRQTARGGALAASGGSCPSCSASRPA